MISYEQVQSSLQGYSPEQLGGLLGPALRGDFAMPQSGSRNEEPAEDFFARLLIASQTPGETRAAIVGACSRLYIELLKVAQVDGPAVPSAKDEATFLRLCRLINMAKPAELEFFVPAVLQTQLLIPNVPVAILGASVRAAMAYPATGERLGLWDKLLLRPALAAYGFQVILSLPVPHERIVRELVRLWMRRLADDWPTDAALLTLQASRQLQEEGIIDDVLIRLHRDYFHLWTGVVVELQRRSTTRGWLDRERLRREQASGDMYSLIEWMAASSVPITEEVTKIYLDSCVWLKAEAYSHFWLLLSDDWSSEPSEEAPKYPRAVNVEETLARVFEARPPVWRVGVGTESARDHWSGRLSSRSSLSAVNRSLLRVQPEVEFADDLTLLAQEARAVTFYSFLHFSGVAHRVFYPLSAPRQLMFPSMIGIKDVL